MQLKDHSLGDRYGNVTSSLYMENAFAKERIPGRYGLHGPYIYGWIFHQRAPLVTLDENLCSLVLSSVDYLIFVPRHGAANVTQRQTTAYSRGNLRQTTVYFCGNLQLFFSDFEIFFFTVNRCMGRMMLQSIAHIFLNY